MPALEPFAEIAGAFWPQLELGRLHLEKDQIPEALRWFEAAVEVTRGMRGEKEPPSYEEEVAVMTSTAKMRQRGLRDEVIDFCGSSGAHIATPLPGWTTQALEERARCRTGSTCKRCSLSPPGIPPCRLRLHHLENNPGPAALIAWSSVCQSGLFPYHRLRKRASGGKDMAIPSTNGIASISAAWSSAPIPTLDGWKGRNWRLAIRRWRPDSAQVKAFENAVHGLLRGAETGGGR